MSTFLKFSLRPICELLSSYVRVFVTQVREFTSQREASFITWSWARWRRATCWTRCWKFFVSNANAHQGFGGRPQRNICCSKKEAASIYCQSTPCSRGRCKTWTKAIPTAHYIPQQPSWVPLCILGFPDLAMGFIPLGVSTPHAHCLLLRLRTNCTLRNPSSATVSSRISDSLNGPAPHTCSHPSCSLCSRVSLCTFMEASGTIISTHLPVLSPFKKTQHVVSTKATLTVWEKKWGKWVIQSGGYELW